MTLLPSNWEAFMLCPFPFVVEPEEEEKDRLMYQRCGLPYAPEPLPGSRITSESSPIDDFLVFPPPERDLDGNEIKESPPILRLEDLFFHKLMALITRAEITDLFILLTAIIATTDHAKYKKNSEEDKDSEEKILSTVLMKDQDWDTFRRGILALLLKLNALVFTPPPTCLEPEIVEGKETYVVCKVNPFSLVGFAQRISLPGPELLIDQARWEWIREKRGGFAFATRHLEDTGVAKDVGTWEWEKAYLWCANLFFILLDTKRKVTEIPDISDKDVLAVDNTPGFVEKLYFPLAWQP